MPGTYRNGWGLGRTVILAPHLGSHLDRLKGLNFGEIRSQGSK